VSHKLWPFHVVIETKMTLFSIKISFKASLGNDWGVIFAYYWRRFIWDEIIMTREFAS
jgi:hypothetical protein